jgi:hypothetical protein
MKAITAWLCVSSDSHTEPSRKSSVGVDLSLIKPPGDVPESTVRAIGNRAGLEGDEVLNAQAGVYRCPVTLMM